MNPESVALEIEKVMTSFAKKHNELVTCIAKSDMSISGIIAAIENNIIHLDEINRMQIEASLIDIGLRRW